MRKPTDKSSNDERVAREYAAYLERWHEVNDPPDRSPIDQQSMDEPAKLTHIREFCNSISNHTTWNAYDLACEIRDFLDGDTASLPV